MHAIMLVLARLSALAGGIVLSALIVLVCLSVTGRALSGLLHNARDIAMLAPIAEWLLALGIGPVTGDFELVEAGTAFAVSAFLPLCTLLSEHARVDVLVQRLGPKMARVLATLFDILLAAAMVTLAVQLWSGTVTKAGTGQTTFLIGFPVWWAYAACAFGLALTAVVACWLTIARLTGSGLATTGERPS